MAKIIYTLVFNRKGQLLKDGIAPVSVCAYLNGKRKYFATDIKIKPEFWDKKRQRIKTTAPNFLQRNNYLTAFVADLERYELDRLAENKAVTLDCLVECLKPQEDRTDFLAFFKTETTNNKKITENTRRVYNSTYKHLSTFRGHITFDDLDYQFIHEFEGYMLGKGINVNSTGKYLKALKAVVNLAINYGILDLNRYPFRNFRIKSQPSSRTYLDPAEIERIEALKIPAYWENTRRVRDMYLFSVYSGLRYSDIIRLRTDHIQDIEGKKYIVLNMEKTKEPLRLPIYLLFNGKPLELLEKCAKPNHKYFFDQFTNQFVNRELKIIARMAKISKTITFHTARHTAATYLIYKEVPMAVVQKILGHTRISTTQVYAKVMDITTENELKKVFGK